jgi:hypothetical protein
VLSKKVKIICDASFDSDLMIATYSGSVTYPAHNGTSITVNYSGNSGVLLDSSAGEIQAALAGLLELKDIMQTECITATSLTIYSDNLTLIDGYQSHKNNPSSSNPKYADQFKLIHRLLNDIHIINVNFTHVRSHIPNHLANSVQKQHNKHDAICLNNRDAITNTIFSPFHEGSKCYAVLLHPETPNSSLFKLVLEAAVILARKGFKARIKFSKACDDIFHNPFIQALNNYSYEANVNVNTLYDIEIKSLKPDFGNCILKHHQLIQSIEGPLSDESLLSFRTAIDTIFGGADFGCHYSHGKGNPIAVCVFDLTRDVDCHPVNHLPVSISEWLDLMPEYIQIEHRFGLPSLIEFSRYGHLKYVSGKRLDRTNKRVYQQIRNYSEGGDITITAKNIQNVLYPNIEDAQPIVDFITYSIQTFRGRIGLNYTLAAHIARTLTTKIITLNRRKNRSPLNNTYQKKLKVMADSIQIDTSRASDLNSLLKAELLQFGPYLTKEDVTGKLIDVLVENGYPSIPQFRTGVGRSVSLLDFSFWRNPDKLVVHCIKTADKFSKALSSKKPITFLNR